MLSIRWAIYTAMVSEWCTARHVCARARIGVRSARPCNGTTETSSPTAPRGEQSIQLGVADRITSPPGMKDTSGARSSTPRKACRKDVENARAPTWVCVRSAALCRGGQSGPTLYGSPRGRFVPPGRRPSLLARSPPLCSCGPIHFVNDVSAHGVRRRTRTATIP